MVHGLVLARATSADRSRALPRHKGRMEGSVDQGNAYEDTQCLMPEMSGRRKDPRCFDGRICKEVASIIHGTITSNHRDKDQELSMDRDLRWLRKLGRGPQ